MSEPLFTEFGQVQAIRQAKYNPLRSFNARSLARMLDNFEYGYLREAALLFEIIAERDDTIKSVKPKREKEVSQLGWSIIPEGNADESEFEAQKDVLEGFWNNVRSVNAYDRNVAGGFSCLLRQMMTSVSYKYAAHHIVWRPTPQGLRATFEFVPLWLFENITGKLRYLEQPYATEGVTMNPDEWMVTAGDGLMIACSIGYLAKRMTFNDWLIFSERFSIPGVLGRTTAAKDSPEGNSVREAVNAFHGDMRGVIYNDNGTHAKPIEIIQANGSPSAMPMPAVIERADRKFAALYRGADLSSMSSGTGEGTGASLQGEEKEILLCDDAEVMNETLKQVSRRVLEWHFGRSVVTAAKLELQVPSTDDDQFLLKASTELADRGVRVSQREVMKRMRIPRADDNEDHLQSKAPRKSESRFTHERDKLANSEDSSPEELIAEDFEARSRELMAEARRRDVEPVAVVLQNALSVESAEEMKRWLEVVEQLAKASSSTEQEEQLERALMTAFLSQDEETEESDDT